jgi:hypothetical protein
MKEGLSMGSMMNTPSFVYSLRIVLVVHYNRMENVVAKNHKPLLQHYNTSGTLRKEPRSDTRQAWQLPRKISRER